MTVTAGIDCVSYQVTDAFAGASDIDVDEWRETPLPYRHIHGGFADCDTRFTFYFPKEKPTCRTDRGPRRGRCARSAGYGRGQDRVRPDAVPRQLLGGDLGQGGDRGRAASQFAWPLLAKTPDSLDVVLTNERTRGAVVAGQPPGPVGSISKLFWSQNLTETSEVASHLLGPRLVADTGEWGTTHGASTCLGRPAIGSRAVPTRSNTTSSPNGCSASRADRGPRRLSVERSTGHDD